jgi:RING finger protein 113A
MPFACHICRDSFTNPVITMCLHYFCANCIHESNKKSSKCPICDKQTFGVFNKATKLIKKLNIENNVNEETIVKHKRSTGSWSTIDS